MSIRIAINRDAILEYARKYDDLVRNTPDESVEKEIKHWFSEHKYLDRQNFLKLCLWKSPRPKKFYEDVINSDERIKTVTSIAFDSSDEYLKIMILQLLKGVSWPVASVILHFASPDKYTVMDFRAIWSLGWEQPNVYDFDFWMKYTEEVNRLAKEYQVDLRTLDKALWMYSRENQS